MAAADQRAPARLEPRFHIRRQVRLKTCADVYQQWRPLKRAYKRAPSDGLEFAVDYIDTGPAVAPGAPVALALHGAPGSYLDFALLINHLSGQGVRVVAPNFPQYAATLRSGALFRHSADEKAAYLRDFLLAIQLTGVDLLVSHSSAIFPSLIVLLHGQRAAVAAGQAPAPRPAHQVCRQRARRCPPRVAATFRQAIDIKAVALLNPAGHRLPKSMQPAWFKCGSVPVYQHRLGRSLFRKLGPAFLTLLGVPVRVANMDNVMLSATVMRNSRLQRLESQLRALSQLQLPSLLVFSENDKLIEKEIFYEMTQFMNLDPKNFDVFDHLGNLQLSQSHTDDWIRVMVFKAGGHYAYSNYSQTVNKAVSELLHRRRRPQGPPSC